MLPNHEHAAVLDQHSVAAADLGHACLTYCLLEVSTKTYCCACRKLWLLLVPHTPLARAP